MVFVYCRWSSIIIRLVSRPISHLFSLFHKTIMTAISHNLGKSFNPLLYVPVDDTIQSFLIRLERLIVAISLTLVAPYCLTTVNAVFPVYSYAGCSISGAAIILVNKRMSIPVLDSVIRLSCEYDTNQIIIPSLIVGGCSALLQYYPGTLFW